MKQLTASILTVLIMFATSSTFAKPRKSYKERVVGYVCHQGLKMSVIEIDLGPGTPVYRYWYPVLNKMGNPVLCNGGY